MLDVIYVGAEIPFFYIIRRYLGPRMPVVAVGAVGFFCTCRRFSVLWTLIVLWHEAW